jgi:nucleoid DNA-binding protein
VTGTSARGLIRVLDFLAFRAAETGQYEKLIAECRLAAGRFSDALTDLFSEMAEIAAAGKRTRPSGFGSLAVSGTRPRRART